MSKKASAPTKRSSSRSVPTIKTEEYAKRREHVLTGLKGAVAVVFAGEGNPPLKGHWHPDLNFAYLTGITDEPGAVVFFDPSAKDPRRRVTLLLRPLNPEVEQWDGYRHMVSARLREQYGFASIARTTSLPAMLSAAVQRVKRLACLHPFAAHTVPVSRDLALYRKVAERIPGVAIEDKTKLLPSLRVIKSAGELTMMREAAKATAAGYEAVVHAIRPGLLESDIAQLMERAFIDAGGQGGAYNPIVGSGVNATVLHYHANASTFGEGDLLLIDYGAEYGGYACDITRTYPVSGRFTPEQRKLYDLVLKAQLAAIKAAKPGSTKSQIDAAARNVIIKGGFKDAYLHGIGHQIGMEVHDVDPGGELKPGMVITIEPGLYLREKAIGIRIEDCILITKDGNQNLTKTIPKKPDEIERLMTKA